MPSDSPSRRFFLLAWPLLAILCAAIFLSQVNQEFYRDEDYEFLYHVASFARLFTMQESQHSWLYQVLIFFHDLLFYRHGALPALYNGIVIGVLDLIGVPITVEVYQLPTALLAITTVFLFLHVLLRTGISRWIALAVAILLAVSPLFTALGRGVHTYIWVWIAFGHVLGIAALQGLREDGNGRWLVGFAFANIVLGDGLFYLSIGAMVAAYALPAAPWARPFNGIASGLRQAPGRLRNLIRLPIVVPAALVLMGLAISAAATIALSSSSIGQSVPLNSLLLAALHHSPANMTGLSSGQEMRMAAVALGEGAPLLLAVIIVALCVPGRNHGFELAFATIASLGFGILIYSIAPHTIGTIQGYQIYTLIPFLLLVALHADRLAAVSRRLRGAVMLPLAVVIAAAGLSMATFVWHAPLAIRPSYFAHGDFGSNKPIFGTKAAGELTRQALLPAFAGGVRDVSVTIYHTGDGPTDQAPFGGFRNWFSPYLLFSGLAQKADWYTARSGHPIKARLDLLETPAESRRAGLTCAADMCVDLTVGDPSGETRQYVVVDGDRRLAALRMTGVTAQALPSGSYDAARLDAAFDRRYTRIVDLFPSRPDDRVRALMMSLRRKFGL